MGRHACRPVPPRWKDLQTRKVKKWTVSSPISHMSEVHSSVAGVRIPAFEMRVKAQFSGVRAAVDEHRESRLYSVDPLGK